MTEILTALLVLAGGLFALAAALGVLRLPDVLIRMHASTKAGTLGCGLILLAVAVHFGESGIVARAVLAIVFLLLTAPVGAHLIGRAAYRTGVPLWQGTVIDELRTDREASDSAAAPGQPSAPDRP
ncbi:monovalent cation/H(+) antiporter subunit G [Pelagibius sp.]|uniref:monovalent cation/H(+) antiporter subunit G n=1 Tax=Pelagibius sp. TaxID=1931238 RepID=UPI002622C0BC|nr:monovalent cation/H(+) antiporter subunit G [Pelagibius sp.]